MILIFNVLASCISMIPPARRVTPFLSGQQLPTRPPPSPLSPLLLLLPSYDLLGRDTPAGRALYALYGGPSRSREAGLAYSATNRARVDHLRATGGPLAPTPSPAAPPPRKTVRVAVPKVGRAPRPEPTAAVDHMPGRKPLTSIQLERQQREAIEKNIPAPIGNQRKLLDDAEKNRLAKHMEFRGKVPVVTKVAPRALRTERDELEEMFDLVKDEIEDRKQRMEVELDPVQRRALTNEIEQRVKELTKIDNLLRDCP